MYSKAEMQHLKREFWIAFAEKHPRKWLLYDTKIKDFSFKFFAGNKKAQVMIDIEMKDGDKRVAYFEKLESLKAILEEDYLSDVIFEKEFTLESGKNISRVWVEKSGVGLSNRNSWNEIFDFFAETMDAFERFFYEFEDYIKAV
jgi:hypothetical protein